jgi:hypothetical protein
MNWSVMVLGTLKIVVLIEEVLEDAVFALVVLQIDVEM